MTLKDQLQTRYLDRLLATHRGRAFVLGQMAEAEGSDEGAIFDRLARRVEDGELQRMIRKHAEDEERHARLFHQCVERTGVDPGPVPAELKIIERIDRALGGFLGQEIEDDLGVMQAYVLLQVIEERAITQFGVIEPILRRHDPGSADVLAEIAADEARHLKYCHAISRRYAPDELTRMRTLRRYRDIEARAFTDNAAANMRYALDHDLLEIAPMEKVLWLGMNRLSAGRRRLDYTPYHGQLAA
jgi:rubrerythrin